ncbi:MAG: shikimate dehydrogenase [Bacteroidales bacterium]|nr:shikimate dehydrogenase [Bacteroidales bacterium]
MKSVKYGLLGHPLGHSFSRKFHNDRFAALGIDAEYLNFDVENVEMLQQILAENSNLRGLNVTIPYKQQVMPMLDELDPLAERIGAVNTIKVMPDGKLKGYNTDIIGFTESLRPMLPEGLQTASLVLGTGGASKAIFVALENLGLNPQYVSRTPGENCITYADLSAEVMASHLVIVNCTPLGMHPKVEGCPAIPYELLTPQHICFDCVYNPAETRFMQLAAAQGAKVKCGQEMLEGQAIASYEIWTSK